MSNASESVPFPLYHGTSTWYLPGILKHGLGSVDVHEQLQTRRFLKEAWELRLKFADGNESREQLSLDSSIISAMTEERVTGGGFNFRYGQVYVTGDQRKAVGYASNRYGSELLTEATRIIEQIRKISEASADRLLSLYPAISDCLKFAHEAVVIKFDRVPRKFVMTETGRELPNDLSEFDQLFSYELVTGASLSNMSIFKAKNVEAGFGGPSHYDLIEFDGNSK